MTVYIVEDDAFHLEDILISIEKLGYHVIGKSDDAFEAQEHIETLKPDVVLMDIHLKGKAAGILLTKRITETLDTSIIFTTTETNKNVITQAAEVSPVAYLTKPITESDLLAALLLAEKSKEKNESTDKSIERQANELFIKSGNKLVKVLISSILFVHTDTKNYCSVVTENNKKLSVRNSILGIQKILNDKDFVQTHRSYIINWEKIDVFNEADQTIDISGFSVPVGRTFRQDLYKKLNIV